MHDSDCYLGEVLQKTGVCLAFLLCNLEVQFLVLLKQVGKHSTEYGNESNNDFDHEQTSFCGSDGCTRPIYRTQRNSYNTTLRIRGLTTRLFPDTLVLDLLL